VFEPLELEDKFKTEDDQIIWNTDILERLLLRLINFFKHKLFSLKTLNYIFYFLKLIISI